MLDVNHLLGISKDYFEDFISRSTYHSNAIEGNTLSFAETYALLFDNNHCTIHNARAKEIHEAINHKYAINKLLKKITSDNHLIDAEFIIEICQCLNENIICLNGYRMSPVCINGLEKTFPLPMELDSVIEDFIDNYNQLIINGFSLYDLANMHSQFENIHPFVDGNGRAGRLLINYLLLVNNKYPIIIPIEKRDDYLQLIENNDITNLAIFFQELHLLEKQRASDFYAMQLEKQGDFNGFSF